MQPEVVPLWEPSPTIPPSTEPSLRPMLVCTGAVGRCRALCWCAEGGAPSLRRVLECIEVGNPSLSPQAHLHRGGQPSLRLVLAPQKCFYLRWEQIWVDSGFAQKLAIWVKLGCSPRYTQMVPKWHLAGHLARTDFLQHAHVARHAMHSGGVPFPLPCAGRGSAKGYGRGYGRGFVRGCGTGSGRGSGRGCARGSSRGCGGG